MNKTHTLNKNQNKVIIPTQHDNLEHVLKMGVSIKK